MKRKYDPQRKHLKHSCVVVPLKDSYQAYEMRCVDCDKHIKWASKPEYEAFLSLENGNE